MVYQNQRALGTLDPQSYGGVATSSSAQNKIHFPTPLMQSRHRAWSLGLPQNCIVPETSSPLVIAVGGGKGGVGKSMISANLAARFARLGFRVAALDMDCGGSNLHTYFGLTGLNHCLGDFLVHSKCAIRDTLSPTPIEGLHVAASQRDDAWSVADSLSSTGMSQLWSGIQSLGRADHGTKYDVVIIDLGAGSARHTIDLFCTAHLGVIAALPEPTSVENSYLFLRTLLFRLIENTGFHLNMQSEVSRIVANLAGDAHFGAAKSYTEKLRLMYQTDPHVVGSVASVLAGRTIGIVMNQTRSQADIDIGKAMEMAGQRYFGFTSQFLGYLNYDEAAWKSLRNKRLLLVDFPQALIAKRIAELSHSILRSVGASI
ncbi:MAG: P-loop NTPase [Proteobacteria bacterium]|nr:P-loop NTPase [Pseudomonadota bacterium]